MLFPRLFGLVLEDDIQEFIARMDIVFVVCDLSAQFLRHLAGLLGVLLALQHQQVIFHIVVDGAYALLVFELVLIVGVLLLKLGDLHLVPLFLLSEIIVIFQIQE